LPDIKFENQALTSFAGLIILQKFFGAMNLQTTLANLLPPSQQWKGF